MTLLTQHVDTYFAELQETVAKLPLQKLIR